MCGSVQGKTCRMNFMTENYEFWKVREWFGFIIMFNGHWGIVETFNVRKRTGNNEANKLKTFCTGWKHKVLELLLNCWEHNPIISIILNQCGAELLNWIFLFRHPNKSSIFIFLFQWFSSNNVTSFLHILLNERQQKKESDLIKDWRRPNGTWKQNHFYFWGEAGAQWSLKNIEIVSDGIILMLVVSFLKELSSQFFFFILLFSSSFAEWLRKKIWSEERYVSLTSHPNGIRDSLSLMKIYKLHQLMHVMLVFVPILFMLDKVWVTILLVQFSKDVEIKHSGTHIKLSANDNHMCENSS